MFSRIPYWTKLMNAKNEQIFHLDISFVWPVTDFTQLPLVLSSVSEHICLVLVSEAFHHCAWLWAVLKIQPQPPTFSCPNSLKVSEFSIHIFKKQFSIFLIAASSSCNGLSRIEEPLLFKLNWVCDFTSRLVYLVNAPFAHQI